MEGGGLLETGRTIIMYSSSGRLVCQEACGSNSYRDSRCGEPSASVGTIHRRCGLETCFISIAVHPFSKGGQACTFDGILRNRELLFFFAFSSQGCDAKLREEDGKPYVTDNDNYIVDLYFTEPIKDANQAGKEVRARFCV